MFRTIAIILLMLGVILALWFLILGGYFSGDILNPDKERAKEIHPFFVGLVVPLVTLGTTLLVFENLMNTSRQNFSNNFLKLIDQHHKLVDNINSEVYGISTTEKCSKGRAFFDDLAHRIVIDYNWLPTSPETGSNLTIKPNSEIETGNCSGKEKLIKIYDYYYHVYQSDIGHYFRNLYRIVRYAESSPFSNSFKEQHIKMLRAQLSNYEILLLAYNGLHPYGKKFYRLIEKYEMLKNLNTEERVPSGWEKRIVDLDLLKGAYPKLKQFLEIEKG